MCMIKFLFGLCELCGEKLDSVLEGDQLLSGNNQLRVGVGPFNQFGLWYEGTGWTNCGAG